MINHLASRWHWPDAAGWIVMLIVLWLCCENWSLRPLVGLVVVLPGVLEMENHHEH